MSKNKKKKQNEGTTYSTYDARTSFSKLLKRVQQGEEIYIANRGKPIAKIVPLVFASEPRKPGSARGTFLIDDSFNDPLPTPVLECFEK